jgi:signal transduction histidine kinase
MGRVQVSCRAETGQLILEVADNGPGIPLADQPHIFEKFYRGSNLSQDTPGTGLGLSIVKSIIDKHQGRIWLESSPLGTTFSVILPIK